jgi:hypothetical protein
MRRERTNSDVAGDSPVGEEAATGWRKGDFDGGAVVPGNDGEALDASALQRLGGRYRRPGWKTARFRAAAVRDDWPRCGDASLLVGEPLAAEQAAVAHVEAEHEEAMRLVSSGRPGCRS